MYNHSQRPRDSEPDNRDLNPNEYSYYIQEHGKECDRLENELNKSLFRKNHITPHATFQSTTKYILGNNNNENIYNNNNNINNIMRKINHTNYNNNSINLNNRILNKNQNQIISQRNYIKNEPQKIDQNENYDDIYYDNRKNPNYNNNKILNPEEKSISQSININKINDINQKNNNLSPYYTEFGMKIYPGNYQGNTFNRPIRDNYYDKVYPKNNRYNLNEIKQDFHTKSAVSQTIPDYILYDDKGNKLRPYYFYDNNNIKYNQYNSYKNDYGNSRFGDQTYDYYLNGPMRSDISKDWRFPPQYYYNPRGNINMNINK